VLGAEGAARITHEDERHGGGGDVPVPVEGVVRSIEAVSCSFAARAPGEQTRHPVPGTDLITPLRSTDDPTGESDGDGNGRMFVAYIVQFDVPADGQKAVASRSA